MRAALCLFLLSVPALADAPAFGSREELRAQVREILLAKSCRECHLGYLASAKPKALKVFDLAQEDWPSTMRDRQFRPLIGRLGESATKAELDTVERFIQAELAARQSGAAPRSPKP